MLTLETRLTRAEKKQDVRVAIVTLLRYLRSLNIRALKFPDKHHAHQGIARSINDFGLTPFEVDAKDVGLALNWLHSQCIVNSRRHGYPGQDLRHCVYLL